MEPFERSEKEHPEQSKSFLTDAWLVPVRKQVMENALRMGQTAVYEYSVARVHTTWAQEILHTPFKINREFSESSPNQKK